MTTYSLLTDYAARSPEAKLLGENGSWMSTRQVLTAVTSTAAALQRFGAVPGDLIAVSSSQTVQTALTLFALNAMGAVAVLCDSRQKPEDCTAGMPIRFFIANGICRENGDCHRLLDLTELPEEALFQPWADADAPAFLIFTSGSTGKQKAVVLSQSNLIWNMRDALPLGGYRAGDLALGVLPMTHVFGLVLLVGTVVAPYGLYLCPKWDPKFVLEAVQRERLTRMNGVPSLFLSMAAHRAEYDLSSLKFGFIGGGPCTPEQFCQIEAALDMTLIPAYGMSECISISIASWRDSQAMRASSVGKFYPHTRGAIVLEDGTLAAVGQEGEICADSPTRMLGYWGEAPDCSALLHSGDLGWVDEAGFLHISGRKKDIIIRNGVNLMPRRIEEALLSLPFVSAAVAVGIPDPVEGELPCVMVVSTEDAAVIQKALAPLLNKNELPARLAVVASIPLTASGKPNRQHIREVLMSWKMQ